MFGQRQQRAASAWGSTDDIVLIGAGLPIPVPGGADQCFPFKPHPEYYWLTGRHREGGVLAYDPNESWTLFETPLSEGEQIWGGSEAPVGRPVEKLDEWLKQRAGRNIRWLGVPKESTADEEFRIKLTHARRPKDATEIALMEEAIRATAVGHEAARSLIKPGITERQLQIELEAAMFRAGADGLGYPTIVGSGPNSAVLHFAPTNRQVGKDEVVLIDAGGEVNGYTADVTRTHPANGAFTTDQQMIYDAVLLANEQVIEGCKIGTEWSELHKVAALSMAGSLQKMGLIRSSAQEAFDSELISLFFPHGIGHMVGLGVRDAGGAFPGRDGQCKVAGVAIRMDLPLEDGYLVTVEPGLYFIPALLRDEERRKKFQNVVDWKAIEPLIGKLGVRIEDNILVTTSGPRNLTEAIPK
jgi:Xaa-Pro aminopeptidase